MGWKVLLLDDNPRSAEGLLAGLSEVGCEVIVVTDKRLLASAKSLSRLASARVDAVLLSVAAPKLAGLNVFDRIHRDTHARGIPVVLVGSDAAVLAEHEASAAPAEGYVRRPAEHAALVAELGAALLGVVGAGCRTAPPPPLVPEAEESTPRSGVAAHAYAAERELLTEGLDALSRTTAGIPSEALSPVVHEPTKRRRVTHEDSDSTARFTVATMTALDAETNAGRVKELEEDLRLARAEAVELALVHERKLTAAAAAFDRKQRELVKTRDATAKRLAVLERAFHLAHGAREQAVRELEEERANSVESNRLLAAAERRLLDEIAGGAFALETAAEDAATTRQELLDTEAAATKQQAGALEEELRRSWAEHDEIAAQREQLRYALEIVQSDLHAAVEERDALRAAAEAPRPEQARGTTTLASAEAVRPPPEGATADAERRLAAVEQRLAEAHREKDDLQARLDREVAMRRADQAVAVGALRGAEERMAALEARAAPLSRPSDRIVTASGELRAARRSLIPESDGARSVPPMSGVIRERQSSMPPPMKSGPRAAARVPVSLEGDRDDTRPAGRSVLFIDGDRAARVNTVRALARASCEVTVRDSCVDMAAALRTFDVIVTEVVGVAIDELLAACRERAPTCAILAWTPAPDAARALFESAGVSGVTVLQKAYRADELVNAVRARLDEPARAASG